MKTTHSLESLQSALEFVRSLDASEIVEEYLQSKHSAHPGTYCAMELDLTDKSTTFCNDASWSCSADEYFGESGILSRTTLISGTRSYDQPGPDDGFEWEEGDDYLHPAGEPQSWIPADRAAEMVEKIASDEYNDGASEIGDPVAFLLSRGWEQFSVSSTPINGWTDNADHQIRNVQQQLEGIESAIESEIAEIEA